MLLRPPRFSPQAALLAALLSCLAFVGCDDATSPVAAAAEIRLSADSVLLFEDSTARLGAAVLTDTGDTLSAPAVRWSSADTTIATVDGSGTVLGRRPGTARVSASLQLRNGSTLQQDALVRVRPRPAALDFVSSSSPFGWIIVGQPVQIAYAFRVTDRTGAPVSGVAVTFIGEGVTLSTAASVTDSAGLAQTVVTTATRAGGATVLARIPGVDKFAFASLYADPPLRLVLSEDSLVMGRGCGLRTVQALLYDPEGRQVTVRTVPMSVLDTTIAKIRRLTGGSYGGQTVDVTGVGVRTTNLVATIPGGSDTVTIRVRRDPVQTFSIDDSRPAEELALGRSFQLNPRATFAPCGALYVSGTTFQSLDEGVATVSPEGVVTARALGVARIAGRWEDSADTITVVVRD